MHIYFEFCPSVFFLLKLIPCKLIAILLSNIILLTICLSQVSHLHSGQIDIQFVEVLKKIQAKAKLVRIGSIPLTELGKIKSYLLNSKSIG